MPELSTEFIAELTKKLRAIGSLKAVGDTWVSFDSSVPPGGVPFCGQTVSRALYADLLTWATAQGKMKTEEEWQAYAAANGGNCPYYSEGDSLTTFRMPCVLGYLRGSSVTTDGGKYKPQALPIPQLKSYQRRDAISLDTPGATDRWGHDGDTPIGSGGTDEYMVDIKQLPNGSITFVTEIEENDIYKADCDKVTPETFHVLVGVYAVGVITNINNTDVSQLQTGLATLEANAVKSVNGVTPIAGNVTLPQINGILIDSWISEDGLSFYRKYSDGWIEQGGRCGGGQPVTVALPLSFSSTNYRIVAVGCLGSTSDSYEQCSIYSKSLDSFRIAGRNASAREWLAVGF